MYGLKIIMFLLITMTVVIGQSGLNRDYDPVVIKGEYLDPFLGDLLDGIKVYRYKSSTDTWLPIPYQIDELDNTNSYFGEKNNQLDSADELVIMTRDMGDQAKDYTVWPNDNTSKARARTEIVVTDPSTGLKAYAYVFYSATLAKSSDSYVSHAFSGAKDIVYGETYQMGHDPNIASGLPTDVVIPNDAGGENVDFFEKQRLRIELLIKGSVYGIDLNESVSIKERMIDFDIKVTKYGLTINAGTINVEQEKPPEVKIGPIRVVRKNQIQIRMALLDDPEKKYPLPLPPFYYYPNQIEMSVALEGLDLSNLSTDDFTVYIKTVTLTHIMNGNAKDMRYHNAQNTPTTGIEIDDQYTPGVGPYALQASDWPGQHWYAHVGDPGALQIKNGTLFSLLELFNQPIGDQQYIAFSEYDDRDGSRLYGDAGLQIIGQSPDYINEVGNLHVSQSNYVLAENKNRQELFDFYDTYSSALQTTVIEQDQVRPAQIADLSIAATTTTSVTLTWQAVGDDGNLGGPVNTNYLAYSTNPIGDDLSEWWDSATIISNLPGPAPPGTIQTFTLEGLDASKNYYFAIRSVDESNNFSTISNVVSITTTPVELATFEAISSKSSVTLFWKTVNESNNLGFQLERKTEKNNNWHPVAFVKGGGTITEPREYTFEDNPGVFGKIYYRLLQIDNDGSQQYLETLSVDLKAPSSFVLGPNYPNPFNPITTIPFEIPQNIDGNMVLIIYDMLGRRVKTLVNEPAITGYHEAKWDGLDEQNNRVGSGVYLGVLTAGDQRTTIKMIKLQ